LVQNPIFYSLLIFYHMPCSCLACGIRITAIIHWVFIFLQKTVSSAPYFLECNYLYLGAQNLILNFLHLPGFQHCVNIPCSYVK